jgi:hypothetical protein
MSHDMFSRIFPATCSYACVHAPCPESCTLMYLYFMLFAWMDGHTHVHVYSNNTPRNVIVQDHFLFHGTMLTCISACFMVSLCNIHVICMHAHMRECKHTTLAYTQHAYIHAYIHGAIMHVSEQIYVDKCTHIYKICACTHITCNMLLLTEREKPCSCTYMHQDGICVCIYIYT